MDQKRLFLAIAISVAILLGFQVLIAPHLPQPPKPPRRRLPTPRPRRRRPRPAPPRPRRSAAGQTVPKEVPRLAIAAHRLRGSISLLGARLDDLVLTDYRETLEPNSPNVRLLEPRSEPQPDHVQYGWSAAPGEQVKLPDNDTVWTGSGGTLSAGHPVTLSWDNGAGLTFQITMSVDDDYMFAVQQSVKNATGAPVKLFPWARIRRDYTPVVAGYYILFEGLLGVVDGKLQESTYSNTKSEGDGQRGITARAIALLDKQSSPLDDNQTLYFLLEEKLKWLKVNQQAIYPYWTVYRVKAQEVEFWQAHTERKHVRLKFARSNDRWVKKQLWP